MAMTRLTNNNSAPLTLPPPFRGVLGPRQSAVANVPLATAVTELGQSLHPSTGLVAEEVQDQAASSYWYPYPEE